MLRAEKKQFTPDACIESARAGRLRAGDRFSVESEIILPGKQYQICARAYTYDTHTRIILCVCVCAYTRMENSFEL